MPNMGWEAFQDSHFRPHLVVAQLSADTEPELVKAILEQLVVGVSGNYALKQDRDGIRVAFENERDAGRVADVLRAKATTPEPEWASSAVGRVDRTAQKRLAAALGKFGKAETRTIAHPAD